MTDGERRDEAGSEVNSVVHPSLRALTAGLVLSATMNGFEALGVSTALPIVSADLHGSNLYGLTFASFTLAQMVGVVAAGAEADRRGPVRPLAAGLFVFAIGLVIAAVAPSMWVVVIGRTVAGLGGGAVTSNTFVSIGRVYPEHLRSSMLAVISSAWVLPGLVGPSIGGWVAERYGWRWVFVGLVPVVCLVAALLLPALRRRIEAEQGAAVSATLDTSDEPTTLTGEPFWDATAARRTVDATVLAIVLGAVLASLASQTWWVPVLGAVFGVPVVLPRLRRLVPPGTAVLRPGIASVVAATGYLFAGFVGAEAFLPLVLEDVRGQSADLAGLALTSGTVLWTVGSWVQARRVDAFRPGSRVAASMALLAVGVVAGGALSFVGFPLWLGYVGWGIGGLGMGIAFNSLSATVFELVDARHVGIASAAAQLVSNLAISLITGINGGLLNLADGLGRSQATGLRWSCALTFCALVVGMVAAVRHDRGDAARSDAASEVPGKALPIG